MGNKRKETTNIERRIYGSLSNMRPLTKVKLTHLVKHNIDHNYKVIDKILSNKISITYSFILEKNDFYLMLYFANNTYTQYYKSPKQKKELDEKFTDFLVCT